MHNAIEIHDLEKTYENSFRALKGVSLSVKEGEIFGLLGPNGAGKSTLINILCGVVKKTSGAVKILNHSIPEEHLAAKWILGVVPQELCAEGFFTVHQVLQYQSGFFGIQNNEDYIEEVLTKLDLIDKREEITRHLSGGMKRRLMVAKAMIHRPKILILDEPTAGVDLGLTVSLWNAVKELNDAGVTIILTTHNLREAEEICDRICIIDHGSVIEMGETRELVRILGNTLQMEVSLQELKGEFNLDVPYELERSGSEGRLKINYKEGELPGILKALST
ncbi:ABC transporter ATP-binding protein, partial [bacterium]|nr:ABC transporter ATP-binding protein [bacterium]